MHGAAAAEEGAGVLGAHRQGQASQQGLDGGVVGQEGSDVRGEAVGQQAKVCREVGGGQGRAEGRFMCGNSNGAGRAESRRQRRRRRAGCPASRCSYPRMSLPRQNFRYCAGPPHSPEMILPMEDSWG